MATRLQLREVAERRFSDTANAVRSDTEWNDYLNEGYRQIIGEDPYWPFLETKSTSLSLAAGVNAVALPTGVWKVLTVFNATDKWALDELTGRRTHLDAYPTGAQDTGTPVSYRIFGGSIQVFPYPAVATVLHAEYAVSPAELDDDADVPLFPSQYHPALTHYALAEAYLDDENGDSSDRHRARFDRFLAQMKRDLLDERGDSYPQISEAWNF